MNKFLATGKLVREPDMKVSPTGTEICTFTIVIDRKFKSAAGEKQSDFIRCIAFKNNAKFINSWFKKGHWIEIEGSIQTGSYTNKDGVKVNTTDCIIDQAGFVGAKAVEPVQTEAPPTFAASAPAPSFGSDEQGFGPLTEENTKLPFDL